MGIIYGTGSTRDESRQSQKSSQNNLEGSTAEKYFFLLWEELQALKKEDKMFQLKGQYSQAKEQ